jgi:hypothetical protein
MPISQTNSSRLLDLPERLRILLFKLNINRSKLAQRLGVSRSYITQLSHGARCSLPVLTLIERLEWECAQGRVSGLPVGTVAGKGSGGLSDYANGTAHRVAPLKGSLASASEPMSVATSGGVLGGPNHVANAGSTGENASVSRQASLPLWSEEGVGQCLLEELSCAQLTTRHLTVDVEDPQAFAMQVEGGAMEPLISPGDCVVVSPREPLRTGSIVVVRLREDLGGEVLVRRLTLSNRGQTLSLCSLSAGFAPLAVELEECEWIYVVRLSVRKL